MGLDVVRIIELGWHPESLGIFVPDDFQGLKGQVYVGLASRRVYHLSSVGGIHLLAFFAHAFRHYDNARIPLYRGNERASDSSVAGGTLQYGHPFLQISPALCFLDHVEINTVLERAGWAEVLELDQDLRFNFGRYSIQPDERRISDGLQNRPCT